MNLAEGDMAWVLLCVHKVCQGATGIEWHSYCRGEVRMIRMLRHGSCIMQDVCQVGGRVGMPGDGHVYSPLTHF
jgi:hypothetical protein